MVLEIILTLVCVMLAYSTVSRECKLDRLIANTRMSRGYLARSEAQATQRVKDALNQLDIHPRLKERLCTVAKVGRQLYSIGKNTTIAIFNSSLTHQAFIKRFSYLIDESERVARAFASEVYSDDTTDALRNITLASEYLKKVARRSRSKSDWPVARARHYAVLHLRYRSELMLFFKKGYAQLAADIEEAAVSTVSRALALKPLHYLADRHWQHAERIAGKSDTRFYRLLARNNGHPAPAKVLSAYRRCKFAWFIVEMESMPYAVFQILCDMLCEGIELTSPDLISAARSHECAAEAAAAATRDVLVTSDRVLKLANSIKWWSSSPTSLCISQLDSAFENDHSMRTKYYALEHKASMLYLDLIEMIRRGL